ncbi:MAG TPA: ribbon-helix-helix protein, CopG family [Acidobacteriaceae bacterium]|jgi:RHH-type rel operon transcriptional repressor/antitoxin RelB|nr:ribbon-helix-helix protein, CopG family [Acidobacteriaceae bacterium]
MATGTLNLRTQAKSIRELDVLAKAQRRTRTDLVNEAIANYIELQRWQMEEIRAAVQEADAGDFVSEQEIAATFKRLLR